MISFIWKSWWRHKERFILLIIGALFISTGLSFLMGLSETNRGTIENSLQQKWNASYDIIVRPAGTKDIMEEKNLLDPNFLSGLSGGISIEDYEKIKAMPDIDVAAPISILGYQGYQVLFGKKTFTKPGIYRVTYNFTEDDGISQSQTVRTTYISAGQTPANFNNGENPYGIDSIAKQQDLASGNFFLLAAVDPLEEAKLVGLDGAVQKETGSRYFTQEDHAFLENIDGFDGKNVKIPVLLSVQSGYQQTISYTFERLDLPFNDKVSAEKTYNKIKEAGGASYLDTVEGLEKEIKQYSADEAHQLLIKSLSGVDPKTGGEVAAGQKNSVQLNMGLMYKSSPLEYKLLKSPYPDRWNLSYEIIPHKKETSLNYPTFRKPVEIPFDASSQIIPQFIGFYDPRKLNLSMDPTTELPMETYRTPFAKYVLNSEGKPVNPPKEVFATSNPFGYLLSPPSMLTTLDAAKQIAGEKPISAIRVKVKDVASLGEESQEKLEKVAREIESLTRLKTQITLGSSPQPLLTHIPEVQNSKSAGWIEQPWIKIGASINIFKETKLGYSGIVVCVLITAMIYVFSTNLVSFLARKRELSILLAIGWRPAIIRKMLWFEAVFLGGMVSLFALGASAVLKLYNQDSTKWDNLLLMVLAIFFIYILGAITPVMMSTKIKPYHVMREGEISSFKRRLVATGGIVSFTFNNLLGRWKRNALSIAAITLPTVLLIVFLFVSIRLNGILFSTWLGQYVSMEVGLPHYIAMGVSLFIAVITTAEIMWQNISERKSEISLLKALGWKNNSIKAMVLIEGALVGVFGGFFGTVIASLTLYFMYGIVPFAEWRILFAGFIPVVFGLLGAWLPSVIAVKIQPAMGMKGSDYHSSKNISL